MGLRFTILKSIGSGAEGVVLEYDEKQILMRLNARVRENLSKIETFFKHRFTKNEVKESLEKAFTGLAEEFKEKTITLP